MVSQTPDESVIAFMSSIHRINSNRERVSAFEEHESHKSVPLAYASASSSTASIPSLHGEHKVVTDIGMMRNESSMEAHASIEDVFRVFVAPVPEVIHQEHQCELHDVPMQSRMPAPKSSRKHDRNASQRVGRWTLDEKILFLYGLNKFGKGRWKKMSVYLPDRSLVQIKSHAQKVLKRLSEGENVFRRLEENSARLHLLLSKLNEPFDAQAASCPSDMTEGNTASRTATGRRKRRSSSPEEGTPQSALDGREHIIAASALCQLAAPTEQQQQQQFSFSESTRPEKEQELSPTPTLCSAFEASTTAGATHAQQNTPVWGASFRGVALS